MMLSPEKPLSAEPEIETSRRGVCGGTRRVTILAIVDQCRCSKRRTGFEVGSTLIEFIRRLLENRQSA